MCRHPSHGGTCRRRGGRCTTSVLWWLPSATDYACGLILIASVDIGCSVADGRPDVIAVEAAVATTFVVLAARAITGPAWPIVAG